LVPLRIVFCGTPAFAVPSLELLSADPEFRIEAVVTQPDRPRGRGREITPSPVKETALAAGIAIFQPEKIKSDQAFDYFKRRAPDAVVIIAYGQIIPRRLLDIPRLGWINVHASLLPKYRGAAPINWAIINGEQITGLSTMQIDAGLDTGPILLKQEMPISADETAPQLTSRLALAGAPLIADTLRKLAQGEIMPVTQDDSQATIARPLTKDDGRIEWSLPATQIYNRIRGLDPWPGAFTHFRGKMCHVWGQPAQAGGAPTAGPGAIHSTGGEIFVGCGAGTALRLDFAKLEARKRVTSREFASGTRLTSADRFA
jgi:methionyl-tRNA formyltransferase